MTENKKITEGWDKRVSDISAHIRLDGKVLSKEALFATYDKAIDFFDLSGKRVYDYGCGGGWLSVYIKERFLEAEYTGFDIAQRSIAGAQKNNPQGNFQKVEPDTVGKGEFAFDCDVFMILSVIQHFPDKDYFDAFFEALNGSKVPYLIMTIKAAETGTQFRTEPYKTTADIGNACFTTKEEIANRLTKYTCVHSTDSKPGEYQYFHFKAKRKAKRAD